MKHNTLINNLLIFIGLLLSQGASSNSNPATQPKVSFSTSLLTAPRFTANTPSLEPSEKDKENTLTFALDFEMPIYENLMSGVGISYIPFKAVDKGAWTWPALDFTFNLKPQFLIKDNLSLYAKTPFGITVSTYFFKQPEGFMSEEAMRDMAATEKMTTFSPWGAGFNVAGLIGTEWYITQRIGVFVEGGYKLWYSWHRKVKNNKPVPEFHGNGMHGWLVGGGLRIVT